MGFVCTAPFESTFTKRSGEVLRIEWPPTRMKAPNGAAFSILITMYKSTGFSSTLASKWFVRQISYESPAMIFFLQHWIAVRYSDRPKSICTDKDLLPSTAGGRSTSGSDFRVSAVL